MERQNTCPNCGTAPELVDSRGGANDGDYFIESYECRQCGMSGKIRGTVDEPDSWGKTGRLFRGDI